MARVHDPMTAAEWLSEHWEPLWPLRGEGDTLRVEQRRGNGFSERSARVAKGMTDYLEPKGNGIWSYESRSFGGHVVIVRLNHAHYRNVAHARAVERVKGEL